MRRVRLLQQREDLARRALNGKPEDTLVRLILPAREHADHLAHDPKVARRRRALERVRERLEHAGRDAERVVVEEVESAPQRDADLLRDARVRSGVLGQERLEHGPDLLARARARRREALGEPVDDREEHVDPVERVATGAELGARRRRGLDGEGVHELDVGLDEGRQSGGGVLGRHRADDVRHAGRHVEQVLGADFLRDAGDERVQLAEVGDEVLRAVLAEVLERLRRRGRDLGVAIVEARGDVGQLERNVRRVEAYPLRVAPDYEDRGIPDLGVRGQLGEEVHDERHHLVVGRVHLGAHRAHREQRRLEVLPAHSRARAGERLLDDVVRAAQADGRAEDGAAVLERVADRVAEVAKVVALLACERAVVVRVVQVADDGPDEARVDVEQRLDGRVRARLADGAREAVPEVERDARDGEIVVRGADGDRLDERQERGEVGHDELRVPLARLGQDAAVPAHPVLVLARRRVEQLRSERRQSRHEVLDDRHRLLQLLRLVDQVHERVDRGVEQRLGRERAEERRYERRAAERARGGVARLEPRPEAREALVVQRGRDPCTRPRSAFFPSIAHARKKLTWCLNIH